MNLKERAKELRTEIPAVFIALSKKEVPLAAKVLAALIIVYAFSPVDLIPDFIPGLGQLDDAIIIPPLIMLTVKLIPDHVLEECREEAGRLLTGSRQERWFYAIPIIVVWLLILWLVIKTVYGIWAPSL